MDHTCIRQTTSRFLFSFLILLSLSVLVSVETAAQAPTVPPNSIVNNASYTLSAPVLAPGSITAIFGSNLTDGTSCLHFRGCDQTLDPATNLLKTTLSGAQVTVNGAPVPIYYSAPGQLGIQMPTNLTGTSATVQVAVNGQTSSPQTVAVSAYSPGIFSINSQGTGQGAIQIANTNIFAAPEGSIPGSQSRPANAGLDFLTIYCTGLGQVSPSVATGALPGGNPPSTTVTKPQVLIGGVQANVTFSGLVPGNAGFYQVNAQVPATVPWGATIPVVLNIGGVQSNTVTIAIARNNNVAGSAPLVLAGAAGSSLTGLQYGIDLFGSTATGFLSVSGIGTTSGGQTNFSGTASGSGTVSCQARGINSTDNNWTISSTATGSLSPALTSLVSSGGSVSGTLSFSTSVTLCGGSQTVTGTQSLTGTVNPGGGTTLIVNTN